jgi:hypothetical protein
MTLLKSMNIYEGLDENKSESENKSKDKNVVVMANTG